MAPASPRPWLNIGNVLERQGRREAAVEAIETAIELAPDFAPSYFNLGRLLMTSGNASKAEEALRAALGSIAVRGRGAVSRQRAGNHGAHRPEAESVLRDAVASDPAHVGALSNLGMLLLEQDAFDEAESLMLRAVAIDPDWGKRVRRGWETSAGKPDVPRKPKPGSATGASRTRIVRAAASLLFSLTARDDLDAQQVYDAHREIGELSRRRSQAARPLRPNR